MNRWWVDARFPDVAEPTYVYNHAVVREQTNRVRTSIPDTTLLYALKANSHPQILEQMNRERLVDGVDVASMGELHKAIKAGFSPASISVTGPSKPLRFLKACLEAQVGTICVESLVELQRICSLGGMKSGMILLRVNPREEIRSFQLKISGRATPFGVDEEDLDEVLDFIKDNSALIPFAGIHVHAGSQCFSARGFSIHAQGAFALAERVECYGLSVSVINLGGGIGYGNWLPYREADVEAFGKQIGHVRKSFDWNGELRTEPGRYLVAPAGVYATPICRLKESRGTTFVILEGGVNHLFALSHEGYQAKQIWVEQQNPREGNRKKVQLVGPLCTPVDRLGGEVALCEPQVGDVLLFPCNGSYGLSFSPMGFLSHPLPNESFVDYK